MAKDQDILESGRPIRLLLIGALPPPVGGISALFQYLVDDLSTRTDVAASVVDMGGVQSGGAKKMFALLRVLWQVARLAPHADVLSLHTGTSSLHLSGIAVSLLGRVYRKPVIIRKSAGIDYRTWGRLRRYMIRWALRSADLFLVETRPQVQSALDDGVPRVEWFPNCRPMKPTAELPRPSSTVCRRFVFLSQVKRAKGVGEIIETAKRLGKDVSVDVYGPFFDDFSEESFSGIDNVHYRGVAPVRDVISLLQQYDALLLPTYYSGEGHPGILVEALSAGIPVICTRWLCLPEVIDETSGILIEPRSSEALFHATKRLVEDEGLCARLRDGVGKRRESFSSEFWMERFVVFCREVAGHVEQSDAVDASVEGRVELPSEQSPNRAA